MNKPPKKITETNPQVNFESSYTATTPVFPLTVDVTPPSIAEDQLPPLNGNERNKNLNNFQPQSSVKPVLTPSKYYEPPKLQNTEFQTTSALIETTIKPNSFNHQNIQWQELRRMFLIPDYEFPLDQGSRPSYGDGPSSFQVNPFNEETKTK